MVPVCFVVYLGIKFDARLHYVQRNDLAIYTIVKSIHIEAK